ncbi:hypothetical protein V5O48_018178 [Marasmius crinis-equi]|uniref:DUF6589 domain-containing protein n=1 Tax=Marasmius crinis-equi TaxID=585013 RepID=A0ABR3ELY0_9AGAR
MSSPPSSLPPSSPTPCRPLSISKGLPPSSPLSSLPPSPSGNSECLIQPCLVTEDPRTPTPIPEGETDDSDSDPGVERSEDIVGTPRTKKRIIMGKVQKKQAITNTTKTYAWELEAALEAVEAERRKKEYFQEMLDSMNRDGYGFGDMVMYFLDPDSWEGSARWHQFLAKSGRLKQILGWFSGGKYPASVRNTVNQWAVQRVCELLKGQAARVTETGLFKTYNREINEAFVSSFDIRNLYQQLEEEGVDLIIRVFEAVAYSKNHSTFLEQWHSQGKVIVTSSILACLKEHNHYNNLSQVMMSIYLYGNGAQRQTITILSRLGICESYLSLVRNEAVDRQPSDTGLAVTAQAPRKPSKECGRWETPWNSATAINFNARKGQEIYNEKELISITKDTQENGTCPTIVELWEATLKKLQTQKLLEAFQNAPPLCKEDIPHNNEEKLLFRHSLVHDITQIAIDFSGQASLSIFVGVAKAKQPLSCHRIEVHRTEIYPLPALNIDESTIKGNAEVDKAVVKELQLDSIEEFWNCARLVAGDQLSLAQLRSLLNIRAGQEGQYDGFS